MLPHKPQTKSKTEEKSQVSHAHALPITHTQHPGGPIFTWGCFHLPLWKPRVLISLPQPQNPSWPSHLSLSFPYGRLSLSNPCPPNVGALASKLLLLLPTALPCLCPKFMHSFQHYPFLPISSLHPHIYKIPWIPTISPSNCSTSTGILHNSPGSSSNTSSLYNSI